jgi:16S rRNA C967 or C1407 C5-methylase (RsmB/RsmF family)
VRLQSVLDEYIPPTVRRNRARVEVTPFDATRVALPHARYDRVLVDAPCSSDRHVLQSAKELAGWSAKRIKQNAERQVLLLLNALRATKVGGVCVYATCSLSRRENDEVIDAVLAKLARNNRNGAGGAQQQVRVKVLPIRLGNGTSAAGSAAASAAAAGSDDSEEDVLYLPMGEATNRGWMVLPDQASFVPAPTAAAAAAGAVDGAAPPAKAVGHGFGPLYFARLKRISAKEAGSDSDDSDEEDSSEESEGEIEPRRRPDRQLPLEEDEEQDE